MRIICRFEPLCNLIIIYSVLQTLIYLIKIDVREDEEQIVKFMEITKMLVIAGYYRARIKGLTNFDKVKYSSFISLRYFHKLQENQSYYLYRIFLFLPTHSPI